MRDGSRRRGSRPRRSERGSSGYRRVRRQERGEHRSSLVVHAEPSAAPLRYLARERETEALMRCTRLCRETLFEDLLAERRANAGTRSTAELDETGDRMQLVRKLVGLGAECVREAANAVELAENSLELGPVAQRDDGADRLASDDGGHAVRDEDAVSSEQHLIGAATAAGQDIAQAPRGNALLDLPAFDRAFEAKQSAGFVVHERDAAVSIRRDHSFAYAVQHRFALLEQGGDVAWLKTEGLAL